MLSGKTSPQCGQGMSASMSSAIRRLSGLQCEAGGVAPEVFEAVNAAFVRVEDVDDDVGIIGDDPLARREAVDRGWADVVLFDETIL